MMKELRISELMDDYRDDEFFPEGERRADPEAVAVRVLKQVHGAAPAKQKMPRRKKLLLAGALAAVLVVLMGAGFPYIQHQLANGTLSFEETPNSKTYSWKSTGPMLDLEDGRLFFLLNSERIDITDQISEDVPYIYNNSDPDAGVTDYVILGGTPEHYGAFEWVVTPDPFTYEGENAPHHEGAEEGVAYAYSYDSYEWVADDYEDGYIQSASHLGLGTVAWHEGEMIPAWLLSAMEELGIPYHFIPAEHVTVVHNTIIRD